MPRSLNVSVAVVRPGVSSVTYSVPAAALEYIELVASGYMDTTGFYRFKSDIALVLDQAAIDFHKRLFDSQSTEDKAVLAPEKRLFDSIGPADFAPAFDVAKALSTSQLVLDKAALSVANILADAFASSDDPYKTAGKALASEFELTDAQTVEAQKLILDSVSFVENVIAVRAFLRVFADTVTPAELVAKTVTKPPFTEQISVADARDVLPIKSIFDAVAMDDGTSIGDGSTYFFQKYLNNVALLSDAESFDFSKPVTDQVGFSEAGLVSAQGYCDITYFAENYVGTSSSF
jgi:hypothetical protein